jgi:excisionase family DNA binding protein
MSANDLKENEKPEPEYLDAPQLAAKLNVSLKSVINWTQARRLPFVKMGRVNRYPRNEIEKRLLSGRLLIDKHLKV